LIETASNGITNGGQQTGRDGGVLAPRTGVWIGIVVKSSLVVSQKGDTQEANDQACHSPPGKSVPEPQPGNQGCKQWHGCIQNGRQASGDVQHRISVERKRVGGIDDAKSKDQFPIGFENIQVALPHHQGEKHQGGNANPQPSRDQGTKLCSAHSHEQK